MIPKTATACKTNIFLPKLIHGKDLEVSFLFIVAKKGKEFTVVGYLNKEKGIEYKPEINPNQFSMYVIDEQKVERQVVVNKAKPRDIEKSEKIVVTGKMNGDTFVATEILLKCPSKYKGRESRRKTWICNWPK